MTKEIKLTQGQAAIVDDWWFDELNQFKWTAHWCPDTKSFYVTRHTPSHNGKRGYTQMHTVVSGAKSGQYTDHINRNALDNREEKLRICTNSQNCINRGKQSNNTSGYKGVFRSSSGKSWVAQIKIDGVQKYLGSYQSKDDAATAYNKSAIELHGHYAILNEVQVKGV